MEKFLGWLDDEMAKLGIETDLELARRGGFSSGSLNNLRKGTRNLGIDLALGIARGLKADPILVLHKADLLPQDVTKDEIIDRLTRILKTWPIEERAHFLQLAFDRDAALERKARHTKDQYHTSGDKKSHAPPTEEKGR